MFNELGTEQFHIKLVQYNENKPHIELTIGQYVPTAFDADKLSDLIKMLQEAQRLFGLEVKTIPYVLQEKFPWGYGSTDGIIPRGVQVTCDERKGTI